MSQQEQQAVDLVYWVKNNVSVKRIYLTGIICMMLGFFGCFLMLVFLRDEHKHFAAYWMMYASVFGSAIMALCFGWEFFQLLKRAVKKSFIGPLLLSIPTSLFVGGLSKGLAERIISSSIQLDPSVYINTISILSALLVLIVLCYMIMAAFTAYALFVGVVVLAKGLVSFFNQSTGFGKKASSLELRELRFFGVLCCLIWFPTLESWGISKTQSAPFKGVIQSVAMYFDHYPYTQCDRKPYDFRFKKIGDNQVSVVRRVEGKTKFLVRKCQSKTTPTPTVN